jgi:hypothetical protein
MKPKTSFWQRIGLHDWFLKKEATQYKEQPHSLTPNDVYHYIIEKFKESISTLSFANRVVFYHEYIICFNPDDYKQFMENKKGIFGIIVQESLKKIYELLKEYRGLGKTVEPSSSRWVFRFVSNPEYRTGDISFIGKLLPDTSQQKEENLRVTFIPRQTGIAETFDVNPEILKGFTFYSEGYYEVPYQDDLVYNDEKVKKNLKSIKARLETIVPDKAYSGKKVEFLMKDEEIVVCGKDEKKEESYIFRIPSEWVNTPLLMIRHDKDENKFSIASFGEKTIVNEKEIHRSEIEHPEWSDLPMNSRIVLNGIVGINIFNA